jgi:mycothiol synthase
MAEPWFDPAGLLVADAGGPRHGLLGFHWTKQHSDDLGEVYVVAVDPAAQGRGLGKALTAAGLDHLASLGVRRIILYVESGNAPAIATYARFGFTHETTHVQYARG